MKTIFRKEPTQKKMFVTREFAGTLKDVWQAWTDPKLLDQWWAPKPWKAQTKSMDFRAGGFWLYCMIGPDGTKAWARLDYKSIAPMKGFETQDLFCDENGNKTDDFPSMNWKNNFIDRGKSTSVEIEISFASQADLEKIAEMGFQEGFTMAHDNLDELLAKK